jgi:hypothetical protein|tara:strand:+ start:1522 stop:1839 length:318 start_codon:yes stop_codon:yes gene_type:complete
MSYYNRYSEFIINGDYVMVPSIVLTPKSSDRKIVYKVGKTRLDKLSDQFYGSPYYGWLIMQANSTYGGQEWNIPDGTIITVPFPLMQSLEDYKSKLDQHFLYYGR